MFRLLASVVAVALAASTSASVLNLNLAVKQTNLDDMRGTFKIVQPLSSRQCPNAVRHASGDDPLSHTDIFMNNKGCDDGYEMEILNNAGEALDAAVTEFAKDRVREIDNLDNDIIVTELYGIERNGRTCGNRVIDILSNNSLVIIIRTNVDVRTPTTLTSLRSDFRYMRIIMEGDKECLYQAPLRPSSATPSQSAAPSIAPSPSTAASVTPEVLTSPSPDSTTAVVDPVTPTPTTDDEEEENEVDPTPTSTQSEEENTNESGGESETPDNTPDGSEEPIPSAEPADDVCFPADATVELENGEVKRMDQVDVGDRVKVGAGKFSDVFMFTHKTANVVNQFITLESENGEVMSATPQHYVYINDRLVAISTAKVGDFVSGGNGQSLRIVSVRREMKSGLYNPQTVEGNIVVNGLQASTFTQSVEMCTAQAMMAPLRMVYKVLGFSLSALNNGGRSIVAYLPKGSAMI